MFNGISQLFTQYMVHFLETLRGLTGNYGWAIVVFAFIVKIALWYPTQSQYKSMKKMQKIQPLLKKIQEKHKDNPEKLQMEQMKVFQENKINPFGGCLPIIIQMPILIGIFMTIRQMTTAGSFAGEVFLWIGSGFAKAAPKIFAASLSERDVPLLILYGLSMYLSQKISATDPSGEQTQKMMNLVMPIFFTAILWNFPSSLILYWLSFNVFSILQQYFIMKEKDPDLVLSTAGGGTATLDEDEELQDDKDLNKVSPSGRSRSRSRKKKGGK